MNVIICLAAAVLGVDRRTLYRKLNKYKSWLARASLYLGIQLANLKPEGIRLSHRKSETR
jgi:NOL1/NOP2/fmu family ribosome biogenesis protein